MRRKRNDAFYDLALISDTEAEAAVMLAEEYVRKVKVEIKKRIP
jgi:hypothetical protein